jgi:hypothetical protein
MSDLQALLQIVAVQRPSVAASLSARSTWSRSASVMRVS